MSSKYKADNKQNWYFMVDQVNVPVLHKKIELALSELWYSFYRDLS